MSTPPLSDEDFDRFMNQVFESVERNGWAVHTLDIEHLPPWAYSIGMSRTGKPDVVIIGLEGTQGGQIINDVCERLYYGLAQGVSGEVLQDVANTPLRLVDLSHAEARPYARVAQFIAKVYQQEPRCMQILWPDSQGRFPDDPLCDPKAIWLQQHTAHPGSRLGPH
jgi:hypothetical protein